MIPNECREGRCRKIIAHRTKIRPGKVCKHKHLEQRLLMLNAVNMCNCNGLKNWRRRPSQGKMTANTRQDDGKHKAR